ncbi:hypothetical protein Tco_0726304 [Tanacetum coccineum]|uniref:Uncharacterized protein n=1 Tax=Tanacetum coccineum TaxID=301880 RepID=A0ABQ4YF90_9ASTR
MWGMSRESAGWGAGGGRGRKRGGRGPTEPEVLRGDGGTRVEGKWTVSIHRGVKLGGGGEMMARGEGGVKGGVGGCRIKRQGMGNGGSSAWRGGRVAGGERGCESQREGEGAERERRSDGGNWRGGVMAAGATVTVRERGEEAENRGWGRQRVKLQSKIDKLKKSSNCGGWWVDLGIASSIGLAIEHVSLLAEILGLSLYVNGCKHVSLLAEVWFHLVYVNGSKCEFV